MLSVIFPGHAVFNRVISQIIGGALAVLLTLSVGVFSAHAKDPELVFLSKLQGTWVGSGRVLAGPDRGKTFKCSLRGKPSRSGIKISMNGKCSVGRFSARMGASIKYSKGVRKYLGRFMGGAKGNGMDIYGDRRGNSLKLRLSRGRTQGKMDLLLQRKNFMRVIISVTDRSRGRDIPVIALDLKKRRRSASLD
ncbi:MAG: hypothetical protein JKY99_01195 [Rhizobiales bacterium]|nr:hypothetical protein [Hyphomicrobiales bacterium]